LLQHKYVHNLNVTHWVCNRVKFVSKPV
jgi:hypothetical protein